jgi:hypothetical protein
MPLVFNEVKVLTVDTTDNQSIVNVGHLNQVISTNPGPTGLKGDQGTSGVTGPKGDQGDQGVTGPKGDQGTSGIQGVTGPKGDQGDQGVTGPKGDQGDQGVTGPKGDQGDQGVTGPQGDQGTSGIQGVTGPQGDQGTSGIQGVTGPQGDQGTSGIQGVTGPKGDQGDQGVTGPQGPIGTPGANGTNGLSITGPPGTNGTNGTNGLSITGPQGPTGLIANGSSSGVTPYWNGSSWVVNSSTLVNNGSNITCNGNMTVQGDASSGGVVTIYKNGANPALNIENASTSSGNAIIYFKKKDSLNRDNVWFTSLADDGHFRIATTTYQGTDKFNNNAIFIEGNNRWIGLGLNTVPTTRLDVASGNPSQSITYLSFLNGEGVNGSDATDSYTTSARFENAIAVGTQVFITSDERIKKNIQEIDDNLALQKLRLIEPKMYNYIDLVERGPTATFGFIAQQVRQHIPNAVSIKTDFIPNILNYFEFINLSENLVQLNNFEGDVLVGDKLKILDQEGEIISIIQNIDPVNKTIQISISREILLTGDELLDTKLFVYGKEVKDFHTLDKANLYTINFAATQELDRIIDWHTKEVDRSVSGDATSVYGTSLRKEIQDLKEENASLKTQLQNVLTRLQNAGL